MLSVKKLVKSFKHAFSGLHGEFRRGHSFRLQVVAYIILLTAILLLKINGLEAVILILVAASVIVLELANSVFERFLDVVSPRVSLEVKEVKDIMAAAVLIASVTAFFVGAIIIIPHLFF
jgi:diacylglycerol kinase